MKNRILIINGHPDKQSFCLALAERYKKGAESTGAECKFVNLIDLHFNPILAYGYRVVSELEPDLLKIQQDILWAEHLVLIYPNWWGTYPALLKGFIDRVFLPNFAFKYHHNSLLWDKLLKGKSARLVVTMDTPKWYYSLIYGSPVSNSMQKGILQFCGINPVRITTFSPVKLSDEKKRLEWLNKIETLGQKHK